MICSNYYEKSYKFRKYKKDGDKIFEEFIAVIGGRGLLGENGKDRYTKLGDRQSIFPEEKRDDIYGLFEEYKKFIEESQEYYDTSLIAHEYVEKIQTNYDAVVVDEVQDLTKSTLDLILKSLKDESKSNFLLCGDVNQVIHPSFFSMSRLKHFFHASKGKELKFSILEKNYRNSKQVIEFANRVLHFKNYHFASEDKMTQGEKEAFFMKSDTENPGNVGFIAKDKEQEIAEKISESINCAVLVLDDKSKEDARKLFGTPLVFSIQEAKGLEFENVILYKFTSHEAYNKIWNVACPDKDIESTIKEIRNSYDRKDVNTSRTKNKEDKSFEEYKFYMNALYVAVTRAINSVYIIGDEKKCNLLRVIEPGERGNVNIENIKKKESSPEEWRDMALKLIDEGNIEQAESIEKKLRLEGKKEYATEITNVLKAKGCHEEAQGSDKDKQAISKLKTEPQKSSTMVPNEKCKQSPNKKKKLTEKKLEENTNRSFLALQNGELQKAEKFIRQGVDVNATGSNGGTLLHLTVIMNCYDVVKLLLEQEADVNAKITGGWTPLHLAARDGHKDVVDLLLEYGAKINATANNRFTPLHLAAHEGNKDIVELLLKNKADVNAGNENGLTPLHVAAQDGHKDVVELLLKNKADVNAGDENGFTPLHWAAHKDNKDIVELLLKNKADVNAGDEDGLTPLHVAAQDGHKDVVDLLLQHGAKVNATTNNRLLLYMWQHTMVIRM